MRTSVARWYIVIPKIPIWVYIKGPLNGNGLHSLVSFVFYCHLVVVYGRSLTFLVIWYIFPRFGFFNQEKSGNPDEEKLRIFFLRESEASFFEVKRLQTTVQKH
jgi:hypothetical protein